MTVKRRAVDEAIGELSFIDTTRRPRIEATASETAAETADTGESGATRWSAPALVRRERIESAVQAAPPPELASHHSSGRLVRTSVKLHQSDLALLSGIARSGWSAGGEKLSQDFVVRAIVRAVLGLETQLDASGLTLADEELFVARVRDAISAKTQAS